MFIKAVIITGAGSGLGRSIAHKFAEKGSAVAVSDIDGEASFVTGGHFPIDGGYTT